jgi:hypothetical protein
MSVLRILRNLAVLVIFTLAVLASTPRAAADKPKACEGAGQPCGLGYPPCCHKLVCEFGGRGVCLKTGF